MKIKPRKVRKWSLIGALLFLGGYSIGASTNNFLARSIEKSSPEIEKKLSDQLGHPLKIGPYKGLRIWGFAVGASKVLEGPKDASRATSSGIKVQFAPIASFFNWKPVIVVNQRN